MRTAAALTQAGERPETRREPENSTRLWAKEGRGMTSPIAIVGMACEVPEARSPEALWENVLAQRRAFRRMPPERLRAEDYLATDPKAPDRTYTVEAALLEGYRFDRTRFRVAGNTFRSTDLAHWLALDVASRALDEAGFPEGKGLPRDTTGVLVGNTLTGEFSRANTMRLRWPYVRRVVDAALAGEGWTPEKRRAFLADLEVRYKTPFPNVGEETLAGGLSNTIAGRICNHLDLGGGGYTVDGACSSSLLAVAHACSALAAGDLDAALAGGVDLSLDPFELVGFAKTEALATGEMRVYDAHGTGFWPGEGCGFLVLMRLEDAAARGVRPHAVIRGWGVSSDGSGGLTRPEPEGQRLALRRAYDRAGFAIHTVPLFEGHGTGTSVGDAVELRTLCASIRECGENAAPAAIGSVKANIGHLKAAAGVAGLLKAVMALKTQVLPPTTGCREPHPELTGERPALRVLTEGECWPSDRPLRVGVSGMGFGGINAHIVLEGTVGDRCRDLDARTRTLLASAQDSELFLLGAKDRAALRQRVQHLLGIAPKLSRAELADLAACLARELENRHVRAALVAATPQELAAGLETLEEWTRQEERTRLDVRRGVCLDDSDRPPRIGFLFPGQGSPSHVSGGALRRRFEPVRELYARTRFPAARDAVDTSVAQPAIVTASLAGLTVLDMLGIAADTAAGHSLGELTAYHWGGALDEPALLGIATARGGVMAEWARDEGAMAVIAADQAEVEDLMTGEAVVIAGLNGPRHTVISGAATGVEVVVARARARTIATRRLPVSHAFHSRLVAPAAKPLAEHLARESFMPLLRTVVSTVTGSALAPDQDLRSLLERQVTSPVRFAEALSHAAENVDLLLEVGPGRVLEGLASGQVEVPVVSLDAGGPTLRSFLTAVGAAYALGAPLETGALFAGRFTRPFDLDWRPRFFANPCEQAPVLDTSLPSERPEPEPETAEVSPPIGEEADALSLFRRLVVERTELPFSAVKAESRLLEDLHLNSIAVSQLAAEAARRLELPPPRALTDYANATVAQVAAALEDLKSARGAGRGREAAPEPPGVDAWIRTFTVELVERSLSRRRPSERPGRWRVIASPGSRLGAALEAQAKRWDGSGCVLVLPPDPDERCIDLLLPGGRAVLEMEGPRRFVAVQHGGGAAPFARTLHLEAPEVTAVVVDVPPEHPRALEWIRAEIEATAGGYVESHYDADGRRRVPVLRMLPLGDEVNGPTLGAEDVMLASGGGKGIAAECAISLARQTGVRLLLLGRSDPASDPVLAANLERMATRGLDVRYQVADVTDVESVEKAVREGEEALGPVTAILHGAGANVPKLIPSLDRSAFLETWAPKVDGARNLLAAVDRNRLKLFLAFGSIISRIGLRGEADYAVANEGLARLVERLRAEQPGCRCLCVEWSVWSGVGMGERLGRVDALAAEGITPIAPAEGISILSSLLASPLPRASVVVTGRFGRPPTLEVEARELPLRRFLEEPRAHYPGVELVAEARVSADADPYLDDHVFLEERIFPAVMSLEALAQAAAALRDADEPPVFENIRFARPVVVAPGESVSLRVAALARGDARVDVALRSEATAFKVDHVRATCRFGSRDTSEAGTTGSPAIPGVPVDPDRDLYGGLLFQGGRFRRVRGYRLLRARTCCVEVAPARDVRWFGRYLPGTLVLGDPAARDAAIHAVQACVPEAALLPVGVDRLVPGVTPDPGPWQVWARERSRAGDTYTYDVEVLGADGRVRERWEGLRFRVVAGTEHRGPWVAPLLGPFIERKVEEWIEGSSVSVVVDRDESGDRRERSVRAIQRARTEPVSVLFRPDGKPEVEGGLEVSASHAGPVTLAVAGPGPVSCDVEPVEVRSDEAWRALLGDDRHGLAGVVAREMEEEPTVAATRVWTAVECLKKSGARSDAPLVLVGSPMKGWVLLASGERRMATFAASVRGAETPLVFAVLARCDSASL